MGLLQYPGNYLVSSLAAWQRNVRIDGATETINSCLAGLPPHPNLPLPEPW